MSDPDEPITPRVTGSYLSFQIEAGRMSAEMYALSQALTLVGPRLHIQASKQCAELAAELEYLVLEFGLWPQCRSETALAKSRARLTFELADLQRRYSALKALHSSADTNRHEPGTDPPRRTQPSRGTPPHAARERPTVPGFISPARSKRRDPDR